MLNNARIGSMELHSRQVGVILLEVQKFRQVGVILSAGWSNTLGRLELQHTHGSLEYTGVLS